MKYINTEYQLIYDGMTLFSLAERKDGTGLQEDEDEWVGGHTREEPPEQNPNISRMN